MRCCFVLPASWMVVMILAVLGPTSAASASPGVAGTLIVRPDQSAIDLDLSLAQTSNRVAGLVDVHYDVGPGLASNTAGVSGLRGVLTEPTFAGIPGFFEITAPANSVFINVTAPAGTPLNNQITPLGDGLYQFTQTGLTVTLDGILTLTGDEGTAEVDLATIPPTTDVVVEDAILAVGGFGGPIPTLSLPLDLVVGLPLDNLTIPVIVSGTLNAFGFDLPGDHNDSGAVEQADLDIVLTSWGQDPGWLRPHYPVVFDTPALDQEELDAVLTNWGSGGVPSLDAASVPEPAAALGVGLGLLAIARTGRRR